MKNTKKIDNESLEFVIGSKENVAWMQIRDQAEKEIGDYKRAIEINEEILKLAKRKIESLN